MGAKITIEFTAPNLCDEESLKENGWTFEEMVKFLIKEEGLFGIVEDDYHILGIEHITAHKDTEGKVPATEDGDKIALLKTGEMDLVQPDETKRPILRTKKSLEELTDFIERFLLANIADLDEDEIAIVLFHKPPSAQISLSALEVIVNNLQKLQTTD